MGTVYKIIAFLMFTISLIGLYCNWFTNNWSFSLAIIFGWIMLLNGKIYDLEKKLEEKNDN